MRIAVRATTQTSRLGRPTNCNVRTGRQTTALTVSFRTDHTLRIRYPTRRNRHAPNSALYRPGRLDNINRTNRRACDGFNARTLLPVQPMKFLDEAKVYIRSGDGGNGCVSFR